jgi:hypothetical protein
MRLFIGLVIALAILVGGGAVLLSTNQAPLPLPPPAKAPPPAAPAQPEKKTMSTEQFRLVGAEVMESIPSRDAYKKGETLPILKAGERFALINEAIGDDPALRDEAITLYRSCAVSGQYQDSVRALCYWYLRRLSKEAGKTVPRKAVPSFIRDLTDQL